MQLGQSLFNPHLAKMLYDSGMSVPDVAKQLGLSTSWTYSQFRQHDIKIRPRIRPVCLENECEEESKSGKSGYCFKHYGKRRRAGLIGKQTKEEVALIEKTRILLTTYNLPLEKAQNIWKNQGESCACCCMEGPEIYEPCREWVVDHDHKCCPNGKSCGECIRGIVCRRCNNYALTEHMTEEIWIRVGKYLGYIRQGKPGIIVYPDGSMENV